jgi:Raf kinase inhibitor-like YbhB/YbcL family protein
VLTVLRRTLAAALTLGGAAALASCGAAAASAEEGATMKLGSPAFAAGTAIPARYTCDGADVSPPLAWSDAPRSAKSFALVVDDPDAPDPKAPRMRWVHWVVYDLPADARAVREAVRGVKDLPAGARMGRNDWNKAAWGGPCPPVGRHRYFFTLYALDTVLGDRGPLTRHDLEQAFDGHVLAQAELMGTYERKR